MHYEPWPTYERDNYGRLWFSSLSYTYSKHSVWFNYLQFSLRTQSYAKLQMTRGNIVIHQVAFISSLVKKRIIYFSWYLRVYQINDIIFHYYNFHLIIMVYDLRTQCAFFNKRIINVLFLTFRLMTPHFSMATSIYVVNIYPWSLLWFLFSPRINLSPFTKDFRGEEHYNESID